MSEQPVTVDAPSAGIEVVSLNRPDRLNAMDAPLIRARQAFFEKRDPRSGER